LAVEDCELSPCEKIMLHTYRNIEGWTQQLLYIWMKIGKTGYLPNG
jgi:hypothetical protein